METLDHLPTNTFSRAFKSGVNAALSKKPITACRCRNVFSIADWRMGWRDAATEDMKLNTICTHPEERVIDGDVFCWLCGINIT